MTAVCRLVKRLEPRMLRSRLLVDIACLTVIFPFNVAWVYDLHGRLTDSHPLVGLLPAAVLVVAPTYSRLTRP